MSERGLPAGFRSLARGYGLIVAGWLLTLTTGCPPPPPTVTREPLPPTPAPLPPETVPPAAIVPPTSVPAASPVSLAQRLTDDPVGCLRALSATCTGLEQYRLTFYRRERLGVVPALQPMEIIRASFRREPFSVRFEWADEKMPYYESVYVAGQNDNKLLIRERRGIFPFPPMVRMVDVDLPVRLGMAKNPITAFGLAQLTARTLAPFDDPKLRGIMSIRYQGRVRLDPPGVEAHHLRIERPPTPGYQYTAQDFYIDDQTGLPAGTDLWLPDGQLDASYRYGEVDTSVRLTDADFRLSRDHPPATTRPASGKPATRPSP